MSPNTMHSQPNKIGRENEEIPKSSAPFQLKKSEMYIVLAWLPICVVLGGVMQILPRELAEPYTLVLLPLLLLFAVLLLGTSVWFRRKSTFRWFLIMLWLYLLFTFIGDLTFSILNILSTEKPLVSIADIPWILAYFFLFSGTLILLYAYRGFRISSKWLTVLCIWFLITMVVMVQTGTALVSSSENMNLIEILVLLIYPVLDAVGIMLLLTVCALYSSSKPRFYWLFLIFSIVVINIADIFYAMDSNYYVGCYVDSIFAVGYCMLALGAYLSLKFTQEDTLKETTDFGKLDKKIRNLIMDGTATSAILFIFFFSFEITQEVIKEYVSGFLPSLGAFISAVILSLLFKVAIGRLEEKMHHREIYKQQVKVFYLSDFELSPEERTRLETLRKTLKLSEEEAEEIEEKALREKEEELRNLEEELRRKEIEYRKEKDREKMKKMWVERLKAKSEELREKSKQLEMISANESKGVRK